MNDYLHCTPTLNFILHSITNIGSVPTGLTTITTTTINTQSNLNLSQFPILLSHYFRFTSTDQSTVSVTNLINTCHNSKTFGTFSFSVTLQNLKPRF